MRRILFSSGILITAFVLTGCATTMAVSSHVESGLDFSRYHTFAWGPPDALPTGDPRLDHDPFFKDHVEGAVERELRRGGFEMTTGATADLLIHYHANVMQRFEIDLADQEYGYCSGGACTADTRSYEAGTLVLDLIDARSNRLIWRGWAQNSVEDLLDNRDRMARAIDTAVARMLRRLPNRL